MSTLEKCLEDPEFKAWVNCRLCLTYVKSGLENFANERSERAHYTVITEVAKINGYNKVCSAARDVIRKNGCWQLRCCNNCNEYVIQIEKLKVPGFSFTKDNWQNSNVQLWPTDAWEMIKVFMKPRQAAFRKNAQDSDISAILSFINHCIIPKIDIANHINITKVRDVNSQMMRSNSMKMCIADFQMFTSSMINLLNDPLFLHVDKNSQDAILKIKKLAATDFHITNTNEGKALKDVATEIQCISNDLKTQIDDLQTDLNKVETNVGQETTTQQDKLEQEMQAREKDKQMPAGSPKSSNSPDLENDKYAKLIEKENQHIEDQHQLEAKSYGINPGLLKILKFSSATFGDILLHGMEENYQIRVMVVGNGRVGKTTLTRRLLQLPVNLKRYDSTNGIDVHIHSCEVDLDTGKWVNKEKYSLSRRLKYWLLGKMKRAKATKTAGDRDFHLRCAKALQKCQDPEQINLIQCTNEKKVLTGDARAYNELPTIWDTCQDESGDSKSNKRESEISSADHQAPCTATSEPKHRLVTDDDLEEALQKAKTLAAYQSSRKAKVSFYDFAGQYVFHASHPTFLSPSAIYILTFDLNRILQKKSVVVTEKFYRDCRGAVEVSDVESIIFWLNIICMFTAFKPDHKPHVILVGTHGDRIPKENRYAIAAKFFREFRSEIAGSPLNVILSKTEFIVDNTKKSDEVYCQLKTEIFELAKLQSTWGEKTPTKWLPLDREVQRLKETGFKVLTLEKLKKINRGLEIQLSNDTEMDAFLQCLHQSGEAVYYSDKLLRDNIVLDPVWLIDALKTVITAEKFAIRTPPLDTQWKEFRESGVIRRSAIVSIFENNKEDPSLFENHEHVLRLMEKFLFIAAPVGIQDQFDANGDKTENDVSYIIPCMVHRAADTTLITRLEGLSRTSVFCMVSMNKFLPPAIFQKLLAMCITEWPIVEQHGEKLIFCGVCKFNLDETSNYKLKVFLVNYAVHARIVSFVDKEQPHRAVCQPVQEFLVQSLRSILRAMGFSDEFRQCIQCPQHSPIDSDGYLDINNLTNQEAVTCDSCLDSHILNVRELLGCWIDMKKDEEELAGIGEDACVDEEKVTEPDVEEQDTEGPMTQQHMNHARLCNVLLTVCADVLRDILMSQIPPGYANFYAALLANKPTLTAMRHIRQEQIDLLFPDPQGRFTGTVDQFDISLLYSLIRNISPVPAPLTGWGKPLVDQPRDISLGASVERIRVCRNCVNGHSADGRLEDQIFEDRWNEISAIMDDIENSIGPKGYRIALDDRKNQVFTIKEAHTLKLELKELKEANKNLMENKDGILKKLQAIVEDYR